MTSDIKKRFLFTVASIIVFIETIIVDLIYMGDKRVVIFLLISIVPFSWLTFAILKSKAIKNNPLIITQPFHFRGTDKPEESSFLEYYNIPNCAFLSLHSQHRTTRHRHQNTSCKRSIKLVYIWSIYSFMYKSF